MADVFDKAKRSEVMSKIRSKNTKAELTVFAYLRKQKVYFQKHYDKASGKPDVALPRKKLAVFIDGDFWHGRTLEALKLRRPGLNDYWVNKIQNNVRRDNEQRARLTKDGWKVLVVWEKDILRKKTREAALSEIRYFLVEEEINRDAMLLAELVYDARQEKKRQREKL